MEQTLYLPDRAKLSSAALPTGTASILNGTRTDVSTGRVIVVFCYLDAGYKILKTVAGEARKST